MNKKEDRTRTPKRTLLETSNNTVENSREYSKIVNERDIWKNLIRNSFEGIKKKKNKEERDFLLILRFAVRVSYNRKFI